MRIKNNVLKLINNAQSRMRIALALNTTERTIIRQINTNSKLLTTAEALVAISKETGLTREEILETELV